jgi:putative Holliday junction resolvase
MPLHPRHPSRPIELLPPPGRVDGSKKLFQLIPPLDSPLCQISDHANQKRGRRARVPQGPMPILDEDSVVVREGIEASIRKVGQEAAPEPHGAEGRIRQDEATVADQLAVEKPQVEGKIVGHEGGIAEEFQESLRDFREAGRRSHHLVTNSRQVRDELRDGGFGVEKGREFPDGGPSLHPDGSDLQDAILLGPAAGRLQIYHGEDGVPERDRGWHRSRGETHRPIPCDPEARIPVESRAQQARRESSGNLPDPENAATGLLGAEGALEPEKLFQLRKQNGDLFPRRRDSPADHGAILAAPALLSSDIALGHNGRGRIMTAGRAAQEMADSVERCLGMDLGDKRIGLALSDALGWTAGPLPPLIRIGWKKDLAALRSLISAHEVRRIVIGLPIRMDGMEGERARRTRDFVDRLKSALPIPIETWDERLTTVEAERVLLQADLRRERRRLVVDSVAASLILQGYLDYRNAGGGPR